MNLTIDGTKYPLQNFPFGASFLCQAGNFWNHCVPAPLQTFEALCIILIFYSEMISDVKITNLIGTV